MATQPQPQPPRGVTVPIPNRSQDPAWNVPGNDNVAPPATVTTWFTR